MSRSAKAKATGETIDLTGVKPSADAVAAEVQRENQAKKKALLGYTKFDFLNTPVTFSRWNLCDVDVSEVKKFVTTMRTGKGLIRYTEETIVPIAISKDAVDMDSLSAELDLGGDSLNDLVLTDPRAEIYAAGGQHRRAALKLFKSDYIQEIEGLEKKMKGSKDAAQLAAYRNQMADLKADLAGLGFWGVAVYDLDLCTANKDYVGKLISKNDDKHRFGETRGEFFVNLMRDFIQKVGDGDLTTELYQELWDQARKKQTDYGELVSQRPLLDMLMDAWFLQHYFATSLLFRPSFLLPQISTHVALFAWAVRRGLNLLRVLSSREKFPSVQDVEQVIQAMQQEGSTLSDETKKQIAILDDGITLGEDKLNIKDAEAATFWTREMLTAIDEVADGSFKYCNSQMGMPEDVYLNALTKYVASVSNTFRQYLASDLAHAELVIARFIWAMHPRTGQITPVPLVTEHVVWSIAESLKIVELGVVEVCRWFEPLLSYPIAPRKGQNRWLDCSTTMLAAIMNDSSFEDGVKAAETVSSYIWESRSTWIVDLQERLVPHMSILVREYEEKDLDGFFPLTKAGKKKKAPVDSSWRHDFLPKQHVEAVEIVVATMKEVAKGVQPTETKPGMTALMGTSWDWKQTSAGSQKRDFQRFAKAAIVEEHRWKAYRTEIVTNSPIATFRKEFQDRLGKLARPTWRDGVSVREWKFVDGLAAPPNKKFEDLEKRKFIDRLRTIEAQNDGLAYMEQIAAIIRLVEKQMVASPDGVANAHQIEKNVGLALEKLVEALVFNGYRLTERKIQGQSPSISPKDLLTLGIMSREFNLKPHQEIPNYDYNVFDGEYEEENPGSGDESESAISTGREDHAKVKSKSKAASKGKAKSGLSKSAKAKAPTAAETVVDKPAAATSKAKGEKPPAGQRKGKGKVVTDSDDEEVPLAAAPPKGGRPPSRRQEALADLPAKQPKARPPSSAHIDDADDTVEAAPPRRTTKPTVHRSLWDDEPAGSKVATKRSREAARDPGDSSSPKAKKPANYKDLVRGDPPV